jgi:hypothetical protein
MVDRLYVLAGTHAQSEYWRKQANISPREWVYLNDPRQLAGAQRPRYTRIGTWWERSDLDRIETQLQICSAVEVERPHE